MKKSLLFIGLFAMVIAFAACGGRGGNKQEESTGCPMEEQCKARAEFEAKWAKFDSLAVEEQEALIAKRVEIYTEKLAKCAEKKAECADKKEHPCKENAEMTEEQKAECIKQKEERIAKMAELKEIFSTKFETFTLAEKKAFFDEVDALKCCKEKKCCKKEGEGCCKKGGEKKCGKEDAEKKCGHKH